VNETLATWLYVAAWYPTLVLADALVARREGRWFLFGRPAFTASVFAWSVPFWLAFEMANLRLDNWHYAGLPENAVERWAGIVIAFATVFPAILVGERAMEALGIARGKDARAGRFRVTPGRRTAIQAAGLACMALTLLWPRTFYPLVWLGSLLLADPFVHRREPSRSLLGDLEQGRPGRIVRILLGGLAIGLLWELYNGAAGARWVYTVPGFDGWKVFAMPLPGFLGFPVFALSGYAAWQALVVTGLAVPRDGDPRPAPRAARIAALVLAAAFTALAILAMERGTVT